MALQRVLLRRPRCLPLASANIPKRTSEPQALRWYSPAPSSVYGGQHRPRQFRQVPSFERPVSRLTRPATQLTREYHSYDHPPSPSPSSFSDVERAILSAAYAHIPSHGFSQQTLALGARDAGYPDISTSILPDGVFGLIRWHLAMQREALAVRSREIFDGKGEAAMIIRDRVHRLTWERLMGNRDIIERWQEALAVMAQPSYIPASVRELSLLVDELWFLAGDVSVDSSWYTKRASLSAIYASSELLMTNDKTPDFSETRDFLRRRFHEADDLGTYARSLGQWVSYTASAGINLLRSKGVRL